MVDAVRRTALGLAVAAVFFLLVEGILWAAGIVPLYDRADPYVGFAGYSPLFVERTTPAGMRVFTTSPGKLRWFNRQQFPATKAAGVTRIFCLGGSTTFGRPYDDATSFCGWLRAFLPAVDPDRRWEVINAGGISYASYRVVRLMSALSRRDADLFIVYSGHNEFLEERTYERIRATPGIVRDLGSLASRLRLYTVLFDAATEQDVLPVNVDAVLDRSVGPEDYHRDDALRKAVLEHYRASLERMTRIGDEAGARVIFVTPASNIGDFSPFKAEPTAGLTAGDRQQAGILKMAASDALNRNDPTRAVELIEQALAIDPRNADLLFLKGRALRAAGRIDEARQAFVAARAEGVAPLRALTPMRGIVADVANGSGAGLVDFARMVEERSPDGIPGSDLFMDHVHPTVDGNRMLALALVDEMIRMGTLEPSTGWNEAVIEEISDRVRAGVDEEENALARRSLANVLIWAGKHEEAERLVDRSVASRPDNGETQYQKATLLVREGRFAEALPHYQEAVRLMPLDAAVRKGYGIVLSELGRKPEAKEALETAARLDPALPGVQYELGVVLGDLGETDAAENAYRAALERDPDHADAANNLGVIYAMRGELETAIELFTRAVRADPEHEDAAANLAQARSMQGR